MTTSEDSMPQPDAASGGDDVTTSSAALTTTTPSPARESPPRKPRARTLPPPVSADEAQRRQRFYAELRRHRRAFGIVGARAPAEEEPPGDDDIRGDGGDVVDADTSPDPRSQQAALYMELMEDELGPVEAGDTAFMRGFPRAFATWDEFDAALERYAQGTFQPLRNHSVQATVARNKSTLKYLSAQLIPGTFIGHFYPESFEWYKKVLVCAICRAASTRSKKLGRVRGGAGAKDTDAKVTAHLQPEVDNSKRFVIDVSWSGAHSHRCDAEELAKFTQGAGRLDDPVLLSLVRKMRQEGKEPRDVKRFIYECTGKKCSTKEVHAMYQRMGTDSAAADEDSAPDDSALDFLNEDQTQQHLPAAAAPVSSAHVRNLSPMIPMDFESMQPSRLQTPDRSISGVLQSIKAVANTLTTPDQAEFASALQGVVNAWTARQKRANAAVAGAGMTPLPGGAAFQFPLPLAQPQQQQQQHLLPSPAGGSATFEYRRYEDVGADLLMGLDTPGSSVLGGGAMGGRSGSLPPASMAPMASRHKRRRS